MRQADCMEYVLTRSGMFWDEPEHHDENYSVSTRTSSNFRKS